MAVNILPSLCCLCKDHPYVAVTPPSRALKDDLSHQRFARLTVQHFFGMVGKYSHWCCLCDCDGSAIIVGTSLLRGNTQSCGCLQREAIQKALVTHGLTKALAYKRWKNMVSRCTNPAHPAFADYGGRGITVCDRWLHSCTDFYADMGEPPAGTWIERIDNNGQYSPGNCIWTTPLRQASNRRNSHFITHDGVTQTLSAWARTLGIKQSTLSSRIQQGWSLERALAVPLGITTQASVS